MIHQPHFLPWPGYIARCLAADTIVFLDNVKFNKSHFQHRTKYVNRSGVETWFTLPIDHSTRSNPIMKVKIAESFDLTHWQWHLEDAYHTEPAFRPIWSELSSTIRSNLPILANVTASTLAYLLQTMTAVLGIHPPVSILASSMETTADRTQRLMELCSEQDITHLIMGQDAVACHDCDILRAGGLSLVRHAYRGPSTRAPRPGVTVLHDIFHLGWAKVAEQLIGEWGLEPIASAVS
jgi:hypothetical protein